MNNGGALRRLNEWWRYWIGAAYTSGVLSRALADLLAALKTIRDVDEQMVETRSFEAEIKDLEGRAKLLAAAMKRTARHEFEVRRRAIKAGDLTAVPETAIPGETRE